MDQLGHTIAMPCRLDVLCITCCDVSCTIRYLVPVHVPVEAMFDVVICDPCFMMVLLLLQVTHSCLKVLLSEVNESGCSGHCEVFSIGIESILKVTCETESSIAV
jgi:hypothetical protein